MELDYKAIGKRIKIARINADMTQEMLSEAVELSPTHLSNIETGTTHVSLSAIVSLANALSVRLMPFYLLALLALMLATHEHLNRR